MGEEIIGRCWHCGHGLVKLDFGREVRCAGCDKGTHVCRNCRFFAPGRPNECQEPLVERVLDKERPNFCDFFTPTRDTDRGRRDPAKPDPRQAAEALFRK